MLCEKICCIQRERERERVLRERERVCSLLQVLLIDL